MTGVNEDGAAALVGVRPSPKAAAPCPAFSQHRICILICERCFWPLVDHVKAEALK